MTLRLAAGGLLSSRWHPVGVTCKDLPWMLWPVCKYTDHLMVVKCHPCKTKGMESMGWSTPRAACPSFILLKNQNKTKNSTRHFKKRYCFNSRRLSLVLKGSPGRNIEPIIFLSASEVEMSFLWIVHTVGPPINSCPVKSVFIYFSNNIWN